MISFLDGPAEGTRLSLQRAPYFLRVVIDQAGKVDALDQLDDEIRPGETAHVYYQTKHLGDAIYCSRGPSRCRRVVSAEYRLYEEQPDQAVLRDNQAWVAWATTTGDRVMGDRKP